MVIFRQYLAILKIFVDLKISVRSTLKELRCELSSSFNIISDSGKKGILFLQIAVMFEMKKNESKRKHRVPEFLTNKKTIQQFNNKTSR